MFEYIKGELEEQRADGVVVETGGFGYWIRTSMTTIAKLPELHQPVKLLLYPAFREDDVTLYGFSSEEERQLFVTLIGISGVGPKAAMSLLSQFDEATLIKHVKNADAKAISRTPGIGKKTADRIILELKDKFKNMPVSDQDVPAAQGATEKMQRQDDLYNEGINGLLGLGYAYKEASDLIDQVIAPDMSIEDLLKAALAAASKM
ncbi:MAG: Holliday junction branch migration protein RuvA [Pseudoramibacter sp.]